jgi:hypothetical protein
MTKWQHCELFNSASEEHAWPRICEMATDLATCCHAHLMSRKDSKHLGEESKEDRNQNKAGVIETGTIDNNIHGMLLSPEKVRE